MECAVDVKRRWRVVAEYRAGGDELGWRWREGRRFGWRKRNEPEDGQISLPSFLELTQEAGRVTVG